MKGRAIIYSAAEMAWLEDHRAMMISAYVDAFRAAFGRDDVTAVHLHSLRKRKGWTTGRTGRFAPGNTPSNKGRPHPSTGRSAETQFKNGERRGGAVKLYRPIGTERISKDGYLERKIHDGMPLQSRWRAIHLVNWEVINGPLPKGICLKCLDGVRSNLDPANWEAIPRALLPRLNGGKGRRLAFNQAEPEIKPMIMAIAKLQHSVRKARRRAVGAGSEGEGLG